MMSKGSLSNCMYIFINKILTSISFYMELSLFFSRFGWEEDQLLPPGFLRKGTEYYTPENQRVEGVAKMLEWLLDRDYPFTVTGPLAREVSWGKIKVERRLRLQGLLNLQMMREGGEGST